MSDTFRHKKIGKFKKAIKNRNTWATRKEVQEAFPELFKKSNGKGSPIAMCNCNGCKTGLRTASGDAVVKRAIRSNRRNTKRALHTGEYELVENTIPVTYTD